MITLNLDNDNIDKLDLVFENNDPLDICSYVKEYYVKNNYIYYNWIYDPNITNHVYKVKFKVKFIIPTNKEVCQGET